MVVKVMDTKSTIDPPWIGMKQFVPKVVARNQREYLKGAQCPKCGAGDPAFCNSYFGPQFQTLKNIKPA